MSELTFFNAHIILPNEAIIGCLHVKDGVISDISTSMRRSNANDSGAQNINCEGDYLLPGLIELHTDNLEHHIEPRPAVKWPHDAALIAHDAELASVGITTVFDAMRVGSFVDMDAEESPYARELASKMLSLRAKGALKISHFLHLRAEICSATLSQELKNFGPEDRIGIVSLMDHTPGQRQFRDLNQFKLYISRKHQMNDAEFAAHCDQLYALRERYGAKHRQDAVAAAQLFGATLASHDDTTVEEVAISADYGVKLAEFPTTLEAAKACRDAGILTMMGAPNLVRGMSHSGNIAAIELAKADVLDIVSSDYIPAALLQSAFCLGRVWDNLARGIAAVTSVPAQAAGLTDRGEIAIGKRADLVRVKVMEQLPVLRGVWSRGERIS